MLSIDKNVLTTSRLKDVIQRVLQNASYSERANYFRKVISKKGALDVAADVIEQTFDKYPEKS